MSVAELDYVSWTGADGRFRSCPVPHFVTGKLVTCKRRDCKRCGNPWAMSWWFVSAVNLRAYNGPVAMVTLTAPGAAERACPCGCGQKIPGLLPWACERKHHHRGDKGCRCDDEALDEWCGTLSDRYRRLREAAWIAARRSLARARACPECGAEPGSGCLSRSGKHVGWLHRVRQQKAASLLERAWEPQKRGAPHAHLVLGMATAEERAAAQAFADELHRLAPTYGFGRVHGGGCDRLETTTARHAADYLASYLTGRSRKKGSIRDNIADPRLPSSLVWVSPKLTKRTLCTMRRLRSVRWYVASLKGRVDVFPRFYGVRMLEIARLATLLDHVRLRVGDDDQGDDELLLDAPSDSHPIVQRHAATLRLMRQVAAA